MDKLKIKFFLECFKIQRGFLAMVIQDERSLLSYKIFKIRMGAYKFRYLTFFSPVQFTMNRYDYKKTCGIK